jgi:hypothetical protein
MIKLTIKILKELIKKSGFKLIYNLSNKEYYLITDYQLVNKNERLIK